MANLSWMKLVVFYFIYVSVCAGVPHARFNEGESDVNVKHADKDVETVQWLRDILLSVGKSAPVAVSDNEEDLLHSNETHRQNNSDSAVDENSALPVLIHKDNELSGIKFPSSTVSSADTSNPFIRSKRSTCDIPANLPQKVRDLNSLLNSTQLVGLIPESRGSNPISGQPSQCHDDVTNKWWPRSEVNLRSTCPWNITEVDLGENAFPRYINKAVCLCVPCIGAPAMRCEETRQTVTYLYRLGCQDGLAVMDTRNVTVTVGCHCVAAVPQPGTPHRRGPITE